MSIFIIFFIFLVIYLPKIILNLFMYGLMKINQAKIGQDIQKLIGNKGIHSLTATQLNDKEILVINSINGVDFNIKISKYQFFLDKYSHYFDSTRTQRIGMLKAHLQFDPQSNEHFKLNSNLMQSDLTIDELATAAIIIEMDLKPYLKFMKMFPQLKITFKDKKATFSISFIDLCIASFKHKVTLVVNSSMSNKDLFILFYTVTFIVLMHYDLTNLFYNYIIFSITAQLTLMDREV